MVSQLLLLTFNWGSMPENVAGLPKNYSEREKGFGEGMESSFLSLAPWCAVLPQHFCFVRDGG